MTTKNKENTSNSKLSTASRVLGNCDLRPKMVY